MSSIEILKDKEYKDIIKKYLDNDKVQTLKNIPHHKYTSRLDHCISVSYASYLICKKLGLDYKSAAIAGLLHDLYFNRINECKTLGDKLKLLTNEHPEDALVNAETIFDLNNIEKDIIVSHMWPISKHLPKHRESFVVSYADKMCSFDEVGSKLSYNLSYISGVFFILLTYSLFK